MASEQETNDLYVHVGLRVKTRRRALNLSQAQLAEFLGVSYQQLQKYENGSAQLSLGRILQLAQALNVGANYFYDGAPAETIGTPIASDLIERRRARPLNLLLVEDSPADAILFDRASQAFKSDLSVFCLNDPELVMDYFRSHQSKYGQGAPDLVVLDLNLPKMTGVQLLKELKSNSQTQATPIVVLTHSISRREMTEVYRIGAAGFLQKTMAFDVYKEAIEIMLQYWLKAVALPLV